MKMTQTPSSIVEAIYQIKSSFDDLEESEYLIFEYDLPAGLGSYIFHLNAESNFRYLGKKTFDTYQGVKLK